MKAKIKVTYDLSDQEGLPPKIEKEIRSKMKKIGAKFYGSGFGHKTGIRDIVYDLEIEE